MTSLPVQTLYHTNYMQLLFYLPLCLVRVTTFLLLPIDVTKVIMYNYDR